MALTANAYYDKRPRADSRSAAGTLKNAEQVYLNALIGVEDASGHLINFDDAAGTKFWGLASQDKLGDTSLDNAEKNKLIVDVSGPKIRVVVATVNNVNFQGEMVYASDENTFTADATGRNHVIGEIDEVLNTSTGECWVQLKSKSEMAT